MGQCWEVQLCLACPILTFWSVCLETYHGLPGTFEGAIWITCIKMDDSELSLIFKGWSCFYFGKISILVYFSAMPAWYIGGQHFLHTRTHPRINAHPRTPPHAHTHTPQHRFREMRHINYLWQLWSELNFFLLKVYFFNLINLNIHVSNSHIRLINLNIPVSKMKKVMLTRIFKLVTGIYKLLIWI